MIRKEEAKKGVLSEKTLLHFFLTFYVKRACKREFESVISKIQ